MSQRSLSIATVLSCAALAGGVMLTLINSAQACPFANKTTLTSGESTPLNPEQLDSQIADINQMGMIAAGTAGAVGLCAAGIAYKVTRAAGNRANQFAADASQEESVDTNSLQIPVMPEMIPSSPAQPETAESPAEEKDLTLVG